MDDFSKIQIDGGFEEFIECVICKQEFFSSNLEELIKEAEDHKCPGSPPPEKHR